MAMTGHLVEIVGIVSITVMVTSAIIKLGMDSTLLSIGVGAIVFIITRRYYKARASINNLDKSREERVE